MTEITETSATLGGNWGRSTPTLHRNLRAIQTCAAGKLRQTTCASPSMHSELAKSVEMNGKTASEMRTAGNNPCPEFMGTVLTNTSLTLFPSTS